tara:strand:+ start:7187 stop:7795 length:609 start_codon:yes stop_codon:yes gene_type:complete
LKNIAIIDYGMGNLFSIKSACKNVGLNGYLSYQENEIMKSDAIILPGVGSFYEAMGKIKARKLDVILKNFLKTKKPMIGICLGMQLFFEISYEQQKTEGLAFIKGEVKSLDANNYLNIGWHSILKKKKHLILNNINDLSRMYFVHSYFCVPSNKKTILTETKYLNKKFCSSIQHENIFGFQFHPEKSGELGLKFYHNLKNLI